jgi:hypothetical protein
MGKAGDEFWEAYRDPRWQRKRLAVMEAADFACEECGAEDKTLNVHHTYYLKGHKPWEYDDDSLKCLCEECHEERHGIADELKTVLSELASVELTRILGYAKGLLLVQRQENPSDDGPKTAIRSHAEAEGLADAAGMYPVGCDVRLPRRVELNGPCAEDRIVEALGPGGTIDAAALGRLVVDHREEVLRYSGLTTAGG